MLMRPGVLRRTTPSGWRTLPAACRQRVAIPRARAEGSTQVVHSYPRVLAEREPECLHGLRQLPSPLDQLDVRPGSELVPLPRVFERCSHCATGTEPDLVHAPSGRPASCKCSESRH